MAAVFSAAFSDPRSGARKVKLVNLFFTICGNADKHMPRLMPFLSIRSCYTSKANADIAASEFLNTLSQFGCALLADRPKTI